MQAGRGGPEFFVGDPLAAVRAVPGVLEVNALLGSGGFSFVYSCTVDDVGRDGAETIRIAAVKLVANSFIEQARDSRILLDLEHPHLVRLYRIHEGPPYAFFFEFCAGGCFDRVIHASTDGGAGWRRLSVWRRSLLALDVGSALEFLHGHGIVHREVTSKNCFLVESLDSAALLASSDGCALPRAKLGYIGVARPAAAYLTTRGIGIVRSMPPEIIACNHYGAPADVFALAILLHELASGSVPYSNLKCNAGALAVAICSGLRPTLEFIPADELRGAELRCLLVQAWLEEPSARPSAAQFVWRLRRLIDREGEQVGAVAEPAQVPAQAPPAKAHASSGRHPGPARAGREEPNPTSGEDSAAVVVLAVVPPPPVQQAVPELSCGPKMAARAEEGATFRPVVGPGSNLHGDKNWVRIL